MGPITPKGGCQYVQSKHVANVYLRRDSWKDMELERKWDDDEFQQRLNRKPLGACHSNVDEQQDEELEVVECEDQRDFDVGGEPISDPSYPPPKPF